MVGLLIFLISALLILGYLLFAPIYIEINSIEELYRIRFHKLFQASLHFEENFPSVQFKIARWRKRISLAGREMEQEKPKKTGKEEKHRFSFKKAIAIINSFKVNRFYLTLCFDNMALNGILYPAFRLVSIKTGKNIEINFLSKNEIILKIENNLYRVLRAYIIN
jgi:hypothetical protein